MEDIGETQEPSPRFLTEESSAEVLIKKLRVYMNMREQNLTTF